MTEPITERAVCRACGWRSPNTYPLGTKTTEQEIARHKKECPKEPKRKAIP